MGLRAWVSAMLLGMAPVVAVVAQTSLGLVPSLGLYIARQLSQAQGGELLVTDTTPPGLGARFELRLPLAERSPTPVLAHAASRR